jgi:hypothetical protein
MFFVPAGAFVALFIWGVTLAFSTIIRVTSGSVQIQKFSDLAATALVLLGAMAAGFVSMSVAAKISPSRRLWPLLVSACVNTTAFWLTIYLGRGAAAHLASFEFGTACAIGSIVAMALVLRRARQSIPPVVTKL